jgi:Rrf2 family iron-sulfur cluster assembly transcriptional regulator
MRLSNQVHYAICGAFDLAYNGAGEPVQVRTIGERQAIPTRYLEQIFQRLRKADLVRGKRGPGGGYVLARDAASITLRDIVEAVEGPLLDGGEAPFEPADPAGEPNTSRPDFLWVELSEGLSEVLASISLEKLCAQAARRAVTRSNMRDLTYQI